MYRIIDAYTHTYIYLLPFNTVPKVAVLGFGFLRLKKLGLPGPQIAKGPTFRALPKITQIQPMAEKIIARHSTIFYKS